MLLLAPLSLPANGVGSDEIRVAIVQGNVPRDFAGSLYDKELTIIQSHADLTATIPSGSVDLVVWPESSVGVDPTTDDRVRTILATAARTAGVPMIVGANLDVDDDHYRVMALLLSPAGDIVDRYQKTHLVPFGEYIPARAALDWIPMLDQVPRDAVAASAKTLFEVGGGTIAPVISFEGDFGSLVRGRIAAGGRLLVVATNTSTWGDSVASAQHVAFSQVRAAENGVWVAHGAISGLSALHRSERRPHRPDRTPDRRGAHRDHELHGRHHALSRASGTGSRSCASSGRFAMVVVGWRRPGNVPG